MPGDEWQRFANLRLLYGYMYAQSGKKMLFMGDEFGADHEWAHDGSLDWHLLQEPLHEGLRHWVENINHLYRNEPALHELECDPAGFEWIDCNDALPVSSRCSGKARNRRIRFAIACNFTPVPRMDYRVGVPHGGFWREVLNSDAHEYGGRRHGEFRRTRSRRDSIPWESPFPLKLVLPPLGALFLKATEGA